MNEATPAITTQVELEQKIAALHLHDEGQTKSIVCGLIGHSRIQTHCFGYYYCGRCSAKLGDSLASIYPGAEVAVIIEHKCDRCVQNYAACDWRDKFMVPNPFDPGQPHPVEEPAVDPAPAAKIKRKKP